MGVKVIWSGPFEAHLLHGGTAQPGDIIEVTETQAAENPGWYRPIEKTRPTATVSKPVAVPDPVEAEAA